MHQDFVILATHLGTQIAPIYRAFSAHSEITVNPSPFVYTTPSDLHALRARCSQMKKARVLVETAALNHSIQTPALSEICTFIYYLGDPRLTLTSLVQEHNYDPVKACDYYGFRLQRLAAMAKNTPKSYFLTWKDLNNETANELVQLLKLKSKIHFSIESNDFNVKPAVGAVADRMCRLYEKYSTKIKDHLNRKVVTADT